MTNKASANLQDAMEILKKTTELDGLKCLLSELIATVGGCLISLAELKNCSDELLEMECMKISTLLHNEGNLMCVKNILKFVQKTGGIK